MAQLKMIGNQKIMKNFFNNSNNMGQNGQKYIKFLKESNSSYILRSQNCIKNKFYCCLRKLIRKINKLLSQKRKKSHKKI